MSPGKIKPTYAELEERVLELEKFHSSLLEMINGFAYCRILYVENNPVDLIFLLVNKSFEVQTGLKNVLNKKLTEIISGIDNSSPKLLEILRRVSFSGTPERFEIFIDALQSWFSVSAFSPSPENFITIFDNITERKNAENELRENEERLKDIIFSIGDWVWEIDENGKYTYTSQKGVEYFGTSTDDIIGKTPFDFIVPEEAERMKKAFSEILINIAPIEDLENWNIKKDGERICFLTNGIPVFDKNGNFKGYRGVDKNITVRKEMEDALHESETRYRLLAENITDVIWVQDIETETFMYVSPSLEQLLGYSANYVMKLGVTNLITKESLSYLNSVIPDRIERYRNGYSEVFSDEIECIHKNGTRVWAEMNSRIVANPANGRPEINGVLRNITGRKRAEQEIQHKNEELAKLVAEKDKFFSVIAHDLRSPFNALLGFTELLADGISFMSQSKLQEISFILRDSAVHLYRLVENLLDWSRIKRGITTFEPTSFLLETEIEENIISVQKFADRKEISITMEVPKNLELKADKYMFGSIIRNLVSNAVKFTNPGGKIDITGHLISNEFIEISVTDNGIGMKDELLSKLFLQDEHLGRKGTEGEPSTGLGLALCKEFVEKHGCDISVESEEGKGSSFFFTMPYRLIPDD